MLAAENGHSDTVKTLLDAGADVNARAKDGVTALMRAEHEGHSEIIQLLKKAGALEFTPIQFAARELEPPRADANAQDPAAALTTARLVLKTRPVTRREVPPDSQLIEAAENGQTEKVKTLLEAGANVNAKNNYGVTALMSAVGKGQTETVQALLDAGADVNDKTEMGVTVLMVAVMNGHTEIAELLKQAGAKE